MSSKSERELYELFSSISTEKEAEMLLSDILTPGERESLAERWQLIQALEKGWSQNELARKTDIPFTTLTKIETWVIKKPSVFTVEQIADTLNVSIDQLIK